MERLPRGRPVRRFSSSRLTPLARREMCQRRLVEADVAYCFERGITVRGRKGTYYYLRHRDIAAEHRADPQIVRRNGIVLLVDRRGRIRSVKWDRSAGRWLRHIDRPWQGGRQHREDDVTTWIGY